MEALVAVGVIAVLALVLSVVGMGQKRTVERAGGLSALRALLEGATADATDRVAGTFRGIPVRWVYATRGAGSSATSWTEITVTLRPGAPVQLSLRPQTRREERLRDEGLVIDLVLGDVAFDDAFVVEGAPADVVRALLDDALRAALLAARPELDLTDGKLDLAWMGWTEDADGIRRALELAIMVAERVPAAVASADAKLEQPRTGPAFREERDAEAERAAKAARAAEVDKLRQVRSQRTTILAQRAWKAMLVIFVIVTATILAMLASR
jgi:hypothetical protein